MFTCVALPLLHSVARSLIDSVALLLLGSCALLLVDGGALLLLLGAALLLIAGRALVLTLRLREALGTDPREMVRSVLVFEDLLDCLELPTWLGSVRGCSSYPVWQRGGGQRRPKRRGRESRGAPGHVILSLVIGLLKLVC